MTRSAGRLEAAPLARTARAGSRRPASAQRARRLGGRRRRRCARGRRRCPSPPARRRASASSGSQLAGHEAAPAARRSRRSRARRPRAGRSTGTAVFDGDRPLGQRGQDRVDRRAPVVEGVQLAGQDQRARVRAQARESTSVGGLLPRGRDLVEAELRVERAPARERPRRGGQQRGAPRRRRRSAQRGRRSRRQSSRRGRARQARERERRRAGRPCRSCAGTGRARRGCRRPVTRAPQRRALGEARRS